MCTSCETLCFACLYKSLKIVNFVFLHFLSAWRLSLLANKPKPTNREANWPLTTIKIHMKIATFNCWGLNKHEKILHLLHDADNYKLNATSLQETHLKVENFTSHTSPKGNKFILHNSKGSTTHKNQCFGGLGFLFDEQLQVTIKTVSDRICYISTYINNRQYYVINVHAPTLPSKEKTPSIRKDLYDKLYNLLHNIPNRAVLYLTGDFNAKTGSGHTTHPAIVGKYGKGQTNSNGELLLDIAQKYNLTIANTLFKHKVAHRTTWTCNAKQTLSGEKNNIIRNKIDYILIRQHHKLHINDCRAYSGTRIDSDHRLVIAAIKEKWSKLKHKSANLIKTDIQSYASQHSIELYQNEIHKLYKNSRDFSTKNTQSKWTNLMNILNTASKVSTHMNKHLNSQFDNEIKTLSDKQKNIKNSLNAINIKEGHQISKYKKLQIERNLVMHQLRQKLKEEKVKQIEQKIKNLEQLTSNPTKMHRAIQDIYKNKKPLLTLCYEKGLTTNEEKQQKL